MPGSMPVDTQAKVSDDVDALIDDVTAYKSLVGAPKPIPT
jgi:hypothetical protein